MPSGPLPGLPMIYAPFAQPGPVRMGANSVYRAFAAAASNYRDFRAVSTVYADFAQRGLIKPLPVKSHGRPLNIFVDQSLVNSGREVVTPKGVVERFGG